MILVVGKKYDTSDLIRFSYESYISIVFYHNPKLSVFMAEWGNSQFLSQKI